jgi:hypothetical protein
VTEATSFEEERAMPNGQEGGAEKPEVVTLSIRLRVPLYQALRELAEEHHRSVNGTISEACKRYVRQMRPRMQRED